MSMSAHILYCHCTHARVVPADVKATVLRRLCESAVPFEAVADLCELASRRDPLLKRLATGAPVKIAACYPRAVQWLFHAAHAPLRTQAVEVLNMRELSADEVLAALVHPQLGPNRRANPASDAAPPVPNSPSTSKAVCS